jgi:hypothetical protein
MNGTVAQPHPRVRRVCRHLCTTASPSARLMETVASARSGRRWSRRAALRAWRSRSRRATRAGAYSAASGRSSSARSS